MMMGVSSKELRVMWIFFGQAVLIVDTVMVGSTMTATETHQVDCIIGNYPFCSVEMHLLQVK